MVAVDDRQCADPTPDSRISRLRLARRGAAAVDVEQRRDHLKVVLDPVVDLADQSALPLQRVRHFAF